jgi:L-histidine N-alpha-methyltransferase
MDQSQRISVHRLSELPDFRANLARDVSEGLRDDPRWFPTKYLYDREGAALFERFSRQPHYYLFSAETDILRQRARDVMEAVRPQEVVELGSGASTKTRLLLEAMHETGCCRYVPLEISEGALRTSAEELTAEYPWLQVDGHLGDFDTDLPKLARKGRRLLVFLGNTVGNFRTRPQRIEFLRKMSAVLVPGDALMLGFDLRKDVGEILAAYADPDGPRQFLMRSVAILTSELGARLPDGGDHFDIDIIWNPAISALEMRLVARRDTELVIEDLQLDLKFGRGEYILLAVSTKFTREMMTEDLAEVGLGVSGWYTDSAQRYAVLIATPSAHT